MEIIKVLHNAVDRLGKVPVIYGIRKLRYDIRFENSQNLNLFRGRFPDVSAALAATPTSKPIGYDHEGPAAMYEERTRQIYISDYPMLFWLSSLFAKGCTSIFDIGGHIGVGYYAYQKFIRYPHSVGWKIYDVPAVVKRGRELATKHGCYDRLTFTTDFRDAEGTDILFASGSIQYLPITLGGLLRNIDKKPKYILVNLLPLHQEETYFTVQSIGTAFCPYRIESRSSFTDGLSELGYQLMDQWENLDKRCDIPFEHPSYSLDRYFGFYFRRGDIDV